MNHCDELEPYLHVSRGNHMIMLQERQNSHQPGQVGVAQELVHTCMQMSLQGN